MEEKKRPNETLLAVVVAIFGIVVSLLKLFPTDSDPLWRAHLLPALGVVVKAIVGLALIPYLWVRLALRRPISAYGGRLPENAPGTARLALVIALVGVAVMAAFSLSPTFIEYYGIPGSSTGWFLAASLALSLIYYCAEEFMFRGFLLFSLHERFGDHSLWVTSLVFALLHLAKSIPEALFALGFSVLLGVISLRSKSFVPAAILHFTIAIVLNALVSLQVGL